MKSILDPSFRYVPSAATDLRKTFARIRLDLRRPDVQISRDAAGPVGTPRLVLVARAK